MHSIIFCFKYDLFPDISLLRNSCFGGFGGAAFGVGAAGAMFGAPAGVTAFGAAPSCLPQARSFDQASLREAPPPPQIRKEFPETWLWQSITEDFNGTQTIQKTVPDTITSWVITGFSIDSVNGLGLTKKPEILEVFQPFFVSLNLPYSVKRGEVLTVPVVVFNYLDDDANTEVTLHNEHQEFEFVGSNDNDNSETGNSFGH